MHIIEYRETLKEPLRFATLLFLVERDRILLAMKKRGFGSGKWNGVGGKPEADDQTIGQTARRETREEIDVDPGDMELVGSLDFFFLNNPDWNQTVVVYFAKSWRGTPRETEEMKPHWYDKKNLPFDEMWADDRIWLPQVLSGKRVKAAFLFDENNELIEHEIEEMQSVSI